MSQPFIHLAVHTEYSLRDSVVRIPELIDAVRADASPAIAITDLYNLFGMLKFYRAALKAGVQPIVGVELALREPDDRQGATRLRLLCQSLEGYRNLTRLISRAWLEGQQRSDPLLAYSWLTPESTRGLIALSGAAQGNVARLIANGREELADGALTRWLDLFGDRYYLEVQRVGRPGEANLNQATVDLAMRRGVPVVATNEVRFLKSLDHEAHEVRVCIHERSQLGDPQRVRLYTPQQYLRSSAEMTALFADLPEALENSVQIARRCALSLELGKARLPDYPVAAGLTPNDFLRTEAESGLEARLATVAVPAMAAGAAGALEPDAYRSRLSTEIGVICEMGFAGYFLIVADFIRWSRDNGVPVGPGRGSGAGSVVAWALRITDIDPLKYDLLFERFLNPERVSMPDFDVDFCMEGRDRVIDYVSHKYGAERVSQIITYGTMAARAVVRDVGRVMGHPFGLVDRVAKLVPQELDITLDAALEKEPELQRLCKSDEEIKALFDMARALEGLTRHAGKHAGGVVIAPSVLTDFAPLYCEEGGANVVTQFDKDDVEAAGLVKFDFLGLRTLTIIDWAMDAINAAREARAEAPLDLATLPMVDAKTYALLKSARTTAVFQLESRGMKDLIRRLQPDCFEDIIALVALFRPGPLQSGMVDDFIARKHDQTGAAVDYLHTELKPVLVSTYGVILYQEQVMQIAQVLAGYSLGGADLLRRAMGKKKAEEMAKERDKFVDGSKARGVPEAQAAMIFDLMEKFAGYGFNKSHSAAYALLTYQTAWLKSHYPAEFMAAVLTSELDNTDKIVGLVNECQEMGLKVLPPDVNESVHAFHATDAGTIRYGLGAVKGVGQGAVEAIEAERAANGPYQSVADLCHRIDLQRLNRRLLEALIRSGSFDSFGIGRATLMESLPDLMRSGEQRSQSAAAGQNDMFGLSAAEASEATTTLRAVPEWSEAQRLTGERASLGLYLTGHPIARFERELRSVVSGRIGDYASEEKPGGEGPARWTDRRVVTVAGLILEINKRGTRTIAQLDDRSGRIEVTFSEEVAERHRELLVADSLVLVSGGLRFDDFSDSWRIGARAVQSIEAVREKQARTLVLDFTVAPDARKREQLAQLLTRFRGGECAIAIRIRAAGAQGMLVLDAAWDVRPTPQLMDDLERLCGNGAVRVSYSAPPREPRPGEAKPASVAAVV
jgi:DNA polymerase-3 subunit alpha